MLEHTICDACFQHLRMDRIIWFQTTQVITEMIGEHAVADLGIMNGVLVLSARCDRDPARGVMRYRANECTSVGWCTIVADIETGMTSVENPKTRPLRFVEVLC